MFYYGIKPQSEHRSCHTIAIENENLEERQNVLNDDEVKEIYKHRCTDCGLQFESMGP